MTGSEDPIRRHPVLAVAVLVPVAGVVYAAVSSLIRASVRPYEVAIFAAIFAVVYVAATVRSGSQE